MTLAIIAIIAIALAAAPASAQVGPPGLGGNGPPGLGGSGPPGLGGNGPPGLGGGNSVTTPLGVGITSVTINRGIVTSRITGLSITGGRRASHNDIPSVAVGAYSVNRIRSGVPAP